MDVIFFDNIIVNTPKKEIYARLGYFKGRTKLNERHQGTVEQYIEDALGIIKLKGSAARIPIQHISDSGIKLARDITFKSASLAKFLKGSREALFMAATAGSDIVKHIREDSGGKDVARAVVLDATASEVTDAALDWIMNYFNRQISREGKCLTKRRFSAGYSDFLLDNQKIIWDTLKMKDLGVELTETFMLVPEKSVTAIAGVELKK